MKLKEPNYQPMHFKSNDSKSAKIRNKMLIESVNKFDQMTRRGK